MSRALNIIEYKKSILNIFHELTEIEIKATIDTVYNDPEKNGTMGSTYIMAVNQCRNILKTILKDSENG